MKQEELKQALNSATDEQKNDMAEWLVSGEGHSVAPLDYFTDKGVPLELLEPMVSRVWSNFVRVPEGITKVALDIQTGRPIGLVEEDVSEYDSGWRFLFTPKEEEQGYQNRVCYSDNRNKRVFVEGVPERDYDDWDTLQALVSKHSPHPHAEHLTDKWDDGVLTIDYEMPVAPQRNSDEDIITELESGSGHYLVKYEGSKRADYINVNKAAWHHSNSKKPTKKAAMEWVKAQLEQDREFNSVLVVGGRIDFRVDGKQRPMKDIAQDKWEWDMKDYEWHSLMLEKEVARCPEVIDFISDTSNVPSGWVHERFMPLGYMDVMWNNNFMVPWVDGVGSTHVIQCIKSTLGIEGETGMLGRGSHARALGGFVLKYLKENNILESDAE